MITRKNIAIFAMLVSCFTLWGLLNNMTDNLVPAFQRIFTMDQSKAGLVQVAFYGAYAVLAIFAAVLAEEFSYRKGVLIGLGVYIVGALAYIPACIERSFDIYFIAIFAVAGGCSLLETTCNPYVLSLGDRESAVRRLNFAQMFNPVGSLAGIILAKQLILAHLNPATAAERAAMDPGALDAIISGELYWVCAPYVGLCAIAAMIWLGFLTIGVEEVTPPAAQPNESGRTQPPAAQPNESGRTQPPAAQPNRGTLKRAAGALAFSVVPMTVLYFLFPEMDKIAWVLCGVAGPVAYVLIAKDYRAMLKVLVRTPKYWCGVVAQFFYVGVQIAAWTWLNVYCQKELGVTPEQGASYYTIAITLFIACRWVATFLMKRFRPERMMALFAAGAIATCAGVMYLPTEVMFTACGLPFSWNVICLVAMSGCMSLMFPTIYGMALGGLDEKALKLGASGLIMAILGGAIITPWMAGIIGDGDSVWCGLTAAFDGTWDENLRLSAASLRASFAVPAICFAVVLAYAIIFNRKGNSK